MSERDPKVYLLPNLMTAGNLFCGFGAILMIFEGALLQASMESAIDSYHRAIWFILGACVFDVLDGRVARLGGFESPFGREFDSLADIVSFGLAPALLVFQIVLHGFDHLGWMIAFVYLACGALRLARFNCVAAAQEHSDTKSGEDSAGPKDFSGFPIPAAAGLISSLTLFMLWMQEGEREIGPWKFALPFLMLFLSFLMFSKVRYPSFKAINWRTQRSIPRFLLIIVLVIFTVMNYQWMPAVIFLSYLGYGFARPWISRRWRRDIEVEIGEEPTGEK